jgi:hypothetical protein
MVPLRARGRDFAGACRARSTGARASSRRCGTANVSSAHARQPRSPPRLPTSSAAPTRHFAVRGTRRGRMRRGRSGSAPFCVCWPSSKAYGTRLPPLAGRRPTCIGCAPRTRNSARVGTRRLPESGDGRSGKLCSYPRSRRPNTLPARVWRRAWPHRLYTLNLPRR